MKKTALLSGVITASFAIVSPAAFGQGAEVAKETVPEKPTPLLITNPENPVLIEDDDAEEVRAQLLKEPFDLETLKGKRYTGCKVLKVDPDGLFFRHDRGMAKLSFTDLPEDVRDRFDFDPEKAGEFIEKHRKIAQKVAEKRAAMIVNNYAPTYYPPAQVYGGGGVGYGSTFGFPFGFPFGVPRSDAAAPYFGYPNISFQAGQPRRPGSPVAPGLVSNEAFRDLQRFVQEGSGYPAPNGVPTVSRHRFGEAPGNFRPSPPSNVAPPVARAPRAAGGGVGLR